MEGQKIRTTVLKNYGNAIDAGDYPDVFSSMTINFLGRLHSMLQIVQVDKEAGAKIRKFIPSAAVGGAKIPNLILVKSTVSVPIGSVEFVITKGPKTLSLSYIPEEFESEESEEEQEPVEKARSTSPVRSFYAARTSAPPVPTVPPGFATLRRETSVKAKPKEEIQKELSDNGEEFLSDDESELYNRISDSFAKLSIYYKKLSQIKK